MLHTLCPICNNPLEKSGNSAVCRCGHTFDFAKEGYLYLLMPNEKHSKDPGDNKEMVLARKAFLECGHYAPLANAVAEIISQTYKNKTITLIDAGVGTGYYLNTVIKSRGLRACASYACADARSAYTHAYNNKDNSDDSESVNSDIKTCSGLKQSEEYDAYQYGTYQYDTYLAADISKYAVKYAAKLNPAAECCVASVYNLPYPDGCADVITCLFSPYAMSEYRRLLKSDGILIVASPCERHLIELRRALYDDVREVETPLPVNGLDIIDERELTYKLKLTSNTEISALLKMTPYVYRAPIDKIAAVESAGYLSLTADFKVTVMRLKRDIDNK